VKTISILEYMKDKSKMDFEMVKEHTLPSVEENMKGNGRMIDFGTEHYIKTEPSLESL